MYVVREAKEEDRVSVVELLVRNLKSLDSFEESWVSSWENYWNKPENEDWAFVATYNDEKHLRECIPKYEGKGDCTVHSRALLV